MRVPQKSGKTLCRRMDDLMKQGRVDQALVTQGRKIGTEALSKLAASQIHDLQKLLSQGIAAFEGMVTSAPAVGLVRRVSADDQFMGAGIAVDVELGPAVLCLFAPDWLTSEIGVRRLPELAELFVQRVREVHRARQRHMDRFARARRMIDAAIQRSSAGMTLVSLKTTPQRVDANLTGCYFKLEATVSMLNDALELHMQRIVAWTPRELASHITHYGPEQRQRLRASARMKASGAVLEIDALAERVIALAGANLAGCALALLTNCDPQHGLGQGLKLTESADGRTSVYLRSGRIMASVWLPGVGQVSGRRFMIDHFFPEAVTDSLAGHAATAIIDRPLLQNVRIASAKRYFGTQTLVRLRMSKRLISAAELDETVPLAA